MDTALFSYIDKQFPRFNEKVCRGFAVSEMEQIETYVDRIIRCAEESFPKGFRYKGYERCTPHEEYNIVTAKRHNKQCYELARSDVYMVKYHFEFTNSEGIIEEIKPRAIYLPFTRDCGRITILGSDFQISPTLADKAISIGIDNLFIPLYRDKLIFKRLVHSFMVDGVRQNSYVIWSSIYHTSKRNTKNVPTQRKTIDVEATNMHYLFCKYGFTRTFVEFGNADVRVGQDDINEKNYPPSEWRICSSMYHGTALRPKGVRNKAYKTSPVRLAIRHEHYNATTESMIAGFFYIVDHFPERMFPEYIDNTHQWMVLMGHVYISEHESVGKLANSIEAHIESLDDYVDVLSMEELRKEGIHVTDIYELFMFVIENFSTLITMGNASVSSMYDKRLKVLRYVAFDIIKAVFNTTFALKKHSKKQLTKKEVLDILNKEFKQELIMGINRGHSEVSSISSPGDNMIFKITSNIVLQTSSTGGARSKKSSIVEPSKFLDASIAEVGSFTNLPKSEPTGRNRINPYVQTSDDGSIVRKEHLRELIDKTQRAIQR